MIHQSEQMCHLFFVVLPSLEGGGGPEIIGLFGGICQLFLKHAERKEYKFENWATAQDVFDWWMDEHYYNCYGQMNLFNGDES